VFDRPTLVWPWLYVYSAVHVPHFQAPHCTGISYRVALTRFRAQSYNASTLDSLAISIRSVADAAIMKTWTRSRTAIIVVSLGALLFASYADVVLGGKTLLGSAHDRRGMPPGPAGLSGPDAAQLPACLDSRAAGGIAEPLAKLTSSVFWGLELPLWNPHTGLGAPLAANMESGVWFPLNIPIWIHPASWSFDAVYLARILLAGFFTALLCRRLGIGTFGAIGGGVAFMLTGYLTLFVNMFHLNTEMLLPLWFYVLDRLATGKAKQEAPAVAVVLGLMVLGGAPQTVALAGVLGFGYYVVRKASCGGPRRSELARGTGWLAVATGLGLGIGCLLFIPFLEYVSLAKHFHEPGVASSPIPARAAISLAVPHFFGPIQQYWAELTWPEIPPYVGAATLLLAGIGAFSGRGARHLRLFFASAAVVSLGILVGAPGLDLLAKAPILNQIIMRKYLVPVIALCASILCGMGIDAVSRGSVRRKFLIAWTVTLLAVMAADGLLYRSDAAQAGAIVWLWRQLAWAGAALLGVVVCAGLSYYRRVAPVVAILAIGVVFGELKGAMPDPRPRRYDPFEAPPFVKVLQADQTHFRILGEHAFLPESATAFGIDDIRGLEALFPRSYFDFMKRYMAPKMTDRFDGVEDVQHYSGLLDLLNVKYLVSTRSIERLDSLDLIKRILSDSQITARDRELVAWVEVQADGQALGVLIEAPPAEIAYPLAVPGVPTRFVFAYGVDRSETPTVHGPVSFEIWVQSGAGREMLFSRTLDLPDNVTVSEWNQGQVDLSPYAGRSIDLILRTDSGPEAAGTPCVWLHFGFEYPGVAPRWIPVYARDVNIYLNRRVMPRAFIVHRAVIAETAPEAFEMMGREDIDLRRTVVLTKPVEEALADCRGAPEVDSSTCRIVRRTSNRVVIDANMANDGLLVVSELNFPGWHACLDGERTKLLAADYLLRAVYVPAGTHTVEFKYRPRSFTLGFLISLVSAAATGVLYFVPRIKASRREQTRGASSAKS